jgi:hypothetical protein
MNLAELRARQGDIPGAIGIVETSPPKPRIRVDLGEAR